MPALNELGNTTMNKNGVNVRNKKGRRAKFKVYKNKKTINTDDVVSKLQSAYSQINSKEIHTFTKLPLSFKTQRGLKENNFIQPTDIQKESIGYALQGCDILGAAKTGSGKTLAFLIPVLEKLFCMKWTRLDGTGALIITPTRELAYQIFETLRKIGIYHDFSAGLIIGGKDLKFETKRMDQCNIVICTPGRLLHHMDENPLFDCVNLQVLVLDEADRCLDMGFEEAMNNIIANLPLNRQTLLFSATQTKSVRDLARLSLKSPKYISVHEHSSYSTPEGLTQSYIVCEVEDKLSMLWSFIKTHYKHKILVFLSSCKQVKYIFEIFCQFRPNVALLALYGSLHQQKRMDIYRSFCNKEHAVLFATDIAARGLDFPAVNWVIQMDCPEDATTYIHRVGRTARYHKGGEALLVLLPSEEEAMLENLKEKKIPINEIKVNPNKLQNPRVKLEAMLAKKVQLKESAQRAFVAYVKSVFLMKDKKVFNVHKLDTDAYARSLGLVVSPRIRFLQKFYKNQSGKEKDSALKNNIKSELIDGTNEIKLENIVKSEAESSDEGSDNEINTGLKIKKEEKQTKTSNKHSKSEITSVAKLKNEIKAEPESSSESDGFNDGKQQMRNAFVKSESNLNSSQLRKFQTFDFGMDDSDSGDDILRVKRTDHDLENEEEDDLIPLEEPGKRKKKAVTKAAVAKTILKRNIVPNKKILFTEEGEAVGDKYKQRVTELGKKYEEEGEGGGICIDEAHKVLREEDKIDKQLFKERVKLKHKEQRMKLKKLRKGGDNDSEEEEEGDNEDYVQHSDAYSSNEENESGNNSSQSDDENDDDDDNSSQNSDVHCSNSDDESNLQSDSADETALSRNLSKGRKRRHENVENDNRKNKFNKTTLSEAEELALKLLSGRSK